MTANELMIGDWVLYTEFDKNTHDRVEIIEPKRVWLEHGRTYTPIEFIQPISLTEEILEKMGFVTHTEHNIFVLSDKIDTIIYHVNDNSCFISATNADMAVYRVKYVHELQHLFKICGIDKEIKLWKKKQ